MSSMMLQNAENDWREIGKYAEISVYYCRFYFIFLKTSVIFRLGSQLLNHIRRVAWLRVFHNFNRRREKSLVVALSLSLPLSYHS